MKVIRISANANGSRPALFDFSGDTPPSGCAFIPESFVPEFYKEGKEAFGFVNISVEGNTVTSCEWDETAYQTFLSSLPKEPEPEPYPEPTQLDRIEAQVTYTAMMTDTLLEE